LILLTDLALIQLKDSCFNSSFSQLVGGIWVFASLMLHRKHGKSWGTSLAHKTNVTSIFLGVNYYLKCKSGTNSLDVWSFGFQFQIIP